MITLCKGHEGRKEGQECRLCGDPHTATYEYIEELLEREYLSKAEVRQAIDEYEKERTTEALDNMRKRLGLE